ncbi:hypothetical protein MC7420_4410 [Coleofasciculus chthonoplastes PCC 7420]|uniref:Uncharacterized protein n=1 Tax=Coleofasciculus chthonoplastes PCC 7420 TaxID=118168 RepID=B4VXY0_9CYAN|nr:hypothetical protein MC7420_4410 [Coleofasciculus chthonoplastes PCC 7420]
MHDSLPLITVMGSRGLGFGVRTFLVGVMGLDMISFAIIERLGWGGFSYIRVTTKC